MDAAFIRGRSPGLCRLRGRDPAHDRADPVLHDRDPADAGYVERLASDRAAAGGDALQTRVDVIHRDVGEPVVRQAPIPSSVRISKIPATGSPFEMQTVYSPPSAIGNRS